MRPTAPRPISLQHDRIYGTAGHYARSVIATVIAISGWVGGQWTSLNSAILNLTPVNFDWPELIAPIRRKRLWHNRLWSVRPFLDRQADI